MEIERDRERILQGPALPLQLGGSDVAIRDGQGRWTVVQGQEERRWPKGGG